MLVMNNYNFDHLRAMLNSLLNKEKENWVEVAFYTDDIEDQLYLDICHHGIQINLYMNLYEAIEFFTTWPPTQNTELTVYKNDYRYPVYTHPIKDFDIELAYQLAKNYHPTSK